MPSVSRREPWVRRRRWTTLAVAVLVLAAGWAGLVALTLRDARGDLRQAQDALQGARDALGEADLAAAAERFAAASAELGGARSRLDRALLAPLGALPGASANLATTRGIAAAAQTIADAGVDVTRAVTALPGGVQALLPREGRLPVDALETLRGPFTDAVTSVEGARERLAATPSDGLLDDVRTARSELAAQLDEGARQLRAAALLARHLPAFLGSEGSRTYFLGAATPAELRGTGGYIGAYSLLTLTDGRPEFASWGATSDLPNLPPDAVPPPDPSYAARYGRYGGSGSWQNLNLTPDFPSAATAIERLWAATTGFEVDGAIVVDPFALRGLLAITGPVEVPGYATLDAESVVGYVTNRAYEDIDDPDQRKQLLGTVAASALESFLGGGALRGDALADGADGAAADAIRAIGDVVGGRHLLVHARDEAVQAAFDEVGIAGRLGAPGGDFLSVVANNASATKLDFYLDRRLRYRVRPLVDGWVEAELEVTFASDAPTGGVDEYVIGPGIDELAAGENLSLVSVYPAEGAAFDVVPGGTPSLPAETTTELGHPVHGGWVQLPAGGIATQRYAWRAPGAWRDEAGTLVYELTYQHQTTIRPTRLEVEVEVPVGFAAVAVPDGAQVVATEGGAAVRWTDDVTGDRTLVVALRALPDRAGGGIRAGSAPRRALADPGHRPEG